MWSMAYCELQNLTKPNLDNTGQVFTNQRERIHIRFLYILISAIVKKTDFRSLHLPLRGFVKKYLV